MKNLNKLCNLLDVKRGIKIFDKLGVKILGLIDHMNYFTDHRISKIFINFARKIKAIYI